jgi:hypothetical protein
MAIQRPQRRSLSLPGVEFGTRGSLSDPFPNPFPIHFQGFYKHFQARIQRAESMKMDHCADRGSGAGKRGKFSSN